MQVTEQSPTAAGEFERVLDARLIMSVVATGIMSFSGVVVETVMNVTFPALMDEFEVNTATVQWMTTAYLLVLAVIMPTRRISTDASPPAASSWWPEFSTSRASYAASAPSRSPMLLVGRVLADGPIRWFPRCSWRSPSCSRRRWARPIWPRLPLPGHARGLRASCLRGGSGALLCGDHGYAVLSPVERGSSVRPSCLAYGTCAHGASWDRMSGIAKAVPLLHTMLHEART